jgi:inward rectifier potassium channel
VKKGLARFDPRDPYYFAVSLSWGRFFLVFIGAEIAINTVFALLYSLQPAAIANQQTPGFVSAFFFSLETLATVGYGEMYPGTVYGHVISGLEIVTGVIFTAIMTGLLFVRFSKPKAKIQYAAHPVVTSHNGRQTLMLRIGNARMSILHDVRVGLYVLARAVSDEGQLQANIVELPLVRDRFPVFAILWTAMHVIEGESPLSAFLSDANTTASLRFFFTISARDPEIGQEVTDLHTFIGSDIRFGMRYVDAIHPESDVRVVADYGLLSVLEPDTTPRKRPTDAGGAAD